MSLLLLLLLGASPAAPPSTGERLVAAARAQVGVTTSYDGAYRRIAYPAGDVPAQTGACTDVVVRAYRHLGIDLQVLVHEDMKAAWSAYPKLWRLSRPDPSIDHRRVPNLVTFFRRHGAPLPVSRRAAGFSPGDIVVWRLASGLPHIGFVSDRRTAQGTPLVIHNIGSGAREEDVLFSYVITGHFRYPPSA